MELTAAAIRPALGRITPSAQLRSFVAIGLACTAAYALLYTLLRDAGMAALPANALSLTLTMGANFAANRRYSFHASDGPLGSQLAFYTVAYLLGLAASSIVLAALLGALGHPHGAADTAAALGAGVVATAIRYVLMRSWVFRPSVSQYEGTLPAPVERRSRPVCRRSRVRALAAHAATGADRPARARGRAQPVGARPERLGQRVLQRRRALDELELAQLPLRVVRPERRDDRGQAADGALGAGAVRPRVRLPPAQHPGAAGADGHGQRGAGLRPHAPALRPRRRRHRRPRARRDPDDRGHLAPQQPGRAARAVLGRRALVRRASAGGRPHALARAVGRLRGTRLRDEDGRGADGGARDRGCLAVGGAAWPARGAAPAARRRGRDGRGGRRMAAARRAHAGRRAGPGSRARATTASGR